MQHLSEPLTSGLSTGEVARRVGCARRTVTLWGARLAAGDSISPAGTAGSLTKVGRTLTGRWLFCPTEVASLLSGRQVFDP